MITRNRRADVARTLGRMTADDASRPVFVVDNGSGDGTAALLSRLFPHVTVIALPGNRGAAARTIGVRAARTDYVAFADDDSWWEPGALALAARTFDTHPRLALLAARIVTDDSGTQDPASVKMARGLIGRDERLPGPAVLGHLACGSVVRSSAYLAAGGYSPLLFFGGEERLLSIDLATRGWQQIYLHELIAQHRPSAARERWPRRWALYRRNDALTACLRSPGPDALRAVWSFLRDSAGDPHLRAELLPLLRRLPGAVAGRRPVGADLAACLRAAHG